MKFSINKIYLWLTFQKEPRTLEFKNNKINVITGGSGKGKSAILHIINYCLLSSETKIVEEVINENVTWYGLDFNINGKRFFIARKALFERKVSEDVYFSAVGKVPELPEKTIAIAELKTILEQEFSVNAQLIIPYGGNKIKAGSKISFRYFLLFNTLSEDIISSSTTFFDYDIHDSEKYREALDRIFDLVIGIDNVENVLIKERIGNIDKEINRIERKKRAYEKEYSLFSENIVKLARQAQEYDLLERKILPIEETHENLKSLINDFRVDKISTELAEYDELNKSRRNLARKIRNLKSFQKEYNTYQESIKRDFDSIRPIEYIEENFSQLIPTPEVGTFLKTLKDELVSIHKKIDKKRTLSVSVEKEISNHEEELNKVNTKLASLSSKSSDFKNEIQKYIFIGELKAKLAFYEKDGGVDEESFDTSSLESDREELQKKLDSSTERRQIIYELLHDRIHRNILLTHSLGVYQDYRPFIDLKEKSLKLRPKGSITPTTVGSKSNFMFLHLFFFLGLHEHFICEKTKFIPQFIIMDQPSQPYFETAKASDKVELNNDDKNKLIDAFTLLNSFIDYVTQKLKTDFQIILLEHAPPEYWKEAKLQNFNLVEEFIGDNALIPVKPD